MRRATRPRGDQRCAVAGERRDVVDTRRLNGLGEGHGRQDGGEPPRRHRFARPRRSQEKGRYDQNACIFQKLAVALCSNLTKQFRVSDPLGIFGGGVKGVLACEFIDRQRHRVTPPFIGGEHLIERPALGAPRRAPSGSAP